MFTEPELLCSVKQKKQERQAALSYNCSGSRPLVKRILDERP